VHNIKKTIIYSASLPNHRLFKKSNIMVTANTSSRANLSIVSVGEPPKKLQKKVETVRFLIHEFMNLQQKRGERIETPLGKAHGYNWKLWVYPLGGTNLPTAADHISVYLLFIGDKKDAPPHVSATFRCKEIKGTNSVTDVFVNGFGFAGFIKRDKIHQYLDDDGTLTIDVDIQVALPHKHVWYPKPLEQQQVLVNLHRSPENADVEFSVNGKIFKAHKCVLAIQGIFLLELFEESDNEKVTISGVTAEIFETLLEYIYTVKEPEFNDMATTKDILVAADKFGVIGLKLLAESTLANIFLAPKTAATLLILADSHACPLLKEAAMNLYSDDPDEVVREDPEWSRVKESSDILHELLMFFRSNKMLPDESCVENFDVGTLRQRLEEANLSLDGTKETLIKRLKDYLEA
jgi:hypothetical protein